MDKTKRDSKGKIERYKARLVAKGFQGSLVLWKEKGHLGEVHSYKKSFTRPTLSS